jgi:hypothetical protein
VIFGCSYCIAIWVYLCLTIMQYALLNPPFDHRHHGRAACNYSPLGIFPKSGDPAIIGLLTWATKAQTRIIEFSTAISISIDINGMRRKRVYQVTRICGCLASLILRERYILPRIPYHILSTQTVILTIAHVHIISDKSYTSDCIKPSMIPV